MAKISIFCLMTILFFTTDYFSQSKRTKSKSETSIKTSSEIKKKLIRQLKNDGEIKGSCVESASNQKFITVKLEDLNRDGKPEFLITLGGEFHYDCAKESMLWYYQETSNGYKKLLGVYTGNRTVDDLTRMKTYHKGFADLGLVMLQGPFIEVIDYEFNGTKYIKKSERIIQVP